MNSLPFAGADPVGDPSIDLAALRTKPVQQRSAKRVTLLLDAAAAIIDEKGIDGLTTTDVASRSDSSVGVVYRYYPNIQSLLLALAGRNLERFMARAAEVLAETPPNWLSGLDPVVDLSVAMMRNEPGFRALRFGTIIDQRVIGSDSTTNAELARRFTETSVERYGLADTPELRFDLEVAVEVSEALIQRAFRNDPHGDERFIGRARTLMHGILATHSAEPPAA
ncbi:TetR/AcrR family transcriptional regulator [Glaciihabitans arcticus]|nr:TetR/AcrR family transcriptional regulator [Glaciihabitans arcticus]